MRCFFSWPGYCPYVKQEENFISLFDNHDVLEVPLGDVTVSIVQRSRFYAEENEEEVLSSAVFQLRKVCENNTRCLL